MMNKANQHGCHGAKQDEAELHIQVKGQDDGQHDDDRHRQDHLDEAGQRHLNIGDMEMVLVVIEAVPN